MSFLGCKARPAKSDINNQIPLILHCSEGVRTWTRIMPWVFLLACCFKVCVDACRKLVKHGQRLVACRTKNRCFWSCKITESNLKRWICLLHLQHHTDINLMNNWSNENILNPSYCDLDVEVSLKYQDIMWAKYVKQCVYKWSPEMMCTSNAQNLYSERHNKLLKLLVYSLYTSCAPTKFATRSVQKCYF